MEEKECVICKKLFSTNRKNKISCSLQCAEIREANLQRDRAEILNKRQRDNYPKNKEKYKSYYQTHKKEILEQRKIRYQNNREQCLEQRKEYRENNSEKVKECKKQSSIKYREENNNKANEYYKNNPERRKKNMVRAMTRHFHNKEKKECEKCGSTENLEFHHPEPYKVDNFQVLCRECHQEETQKNKPKMESIFN